MLTPDKQLSAEQSRQVAETIREEIARRRISRQALGVSLRKGQDTPPAVVPINGEIAPDGLGAYSRRAVAWLEGVYVTLRPSFGGDKDAIYAYRTEIAWDAAGSSLVFREGERLDAAYTQYGEVA